MTDVSTQTALRVLLQGLRLQGDEVQLTHCLAKLADLDDGVGDGLARALLGSAANDPVAGHRAAELLQNLPRGGSWEAETQTRGNLRRAGLRRHAKRGRLDWLLEIPGDQDAPSRLVLGVEVKIDAGITNPLESYYDELQRKGADSWGLLLLARNRPPGRELRDATTREHWLGVALWHHVIERLRGTQPSDPTIAEAWPAFLSIIARDDDLGAEPIVLQDLKGEAIKPKLSILTQHARDAVQTAAKRELTSRALGRSAQPDRFRVHFNPRPTAGSNQAAGLQCYVALDPKDPAVEMTVDLKDGALSLITRVRPADFRLAPRKTRDQRTAIGRLEQLSPPFSPDEHGYVRQAPMKLTGEDLRFEVAQNLGDEISTIVGTGILDHDV